MTDEIVEPGSGLQAAIPPSPGPGNKIERKIDPELLKRWYGIKTVKELSKMFGCRPSSVSKMAKRLGLTALDAKRVKRQVEADTRRILTRQIFTESETRYVQSVNYMSELKRLMTNLSALVDINRSILTDNKWDDPTYMSNAQRDMIAATGALKSMMQLALEYEKLLVDRYTIDLFKQKILEAVGRVDESLKGKILDEIRRAEVEFGAILRDRETDSSRQIAGSGERSKRPDRKSD